MPEFDVIVIGGGSVGQAVAALAEEIGLKTLKVTDRRSRPKASDSMRPKVAIPERIGSTVGAIGKKIAEKAGMREAVAWSEEFAGASEAFAAKSGLKENSSGFYSVPLNAPDLIGEGYRSFEDYRVTALAIHQGYATAAMTEKPVYKFVVAASPTYDAPRVESARMIVIAVGHEAEELAGRVQPGQFFTRPVNHRTVVFDAVKTDPFIEPPRPMDRAFNVYSPFFFGVPVAFNLIAIGESFESGQPDNIGHDALFSLAEFKVPGAEMKATEIVTSGWQEEPTGYALPTIVRFGRRQAGEVVVVTNYGNQGLELAGGLARDVMRPYL